MYISAVLKLHGHDVRVLNYNIKEYDFEQEVKGSDRVLFTGFEEFYMNIASDARLCKSQGIKTIVGGALATFIPEMMLKICDTVVMNEGDSEEVLDTALQKTGMVFGRPCDWWNVLPDYEGFGIDAYNERHKVRYVGVLGSRGCPYSCTFCAHTCQYSERPVESLMQEILLYKHKYHVDMIVFNDNTLNVNESRFMDIIDGMESMNLAWSASIRLDKLTDYVVKRMSDSGCKYLIVGIESFNQHRLDMMGKHMRASDIIRSLDLLHKYKIDYHGNVLVGFTGDTMDNVQSEISSIPEGYNVFPTRVKPFVGIKELCNHNLSADEVEYVDNVFLEYVTSRGKYLYPDLPEMKA
jgi:radical SAM superfamily enzyme YgiQ (UPF0313 family)